VEPVGTFQFADRDNLTYAILFPALTAFTSVLIEVFRVMSGGGEER
jgi:inner membrane protein involved in colicin E2 resistance